MNFNNQMPQDGWEKNYKNRIKSIAVGMRGAPNGRGRVKGTQIWWDRKDLPGYKDFPICEYVSSISLPWREEDVESNLLLIKEAVSAVKEERAVDLKTALCFISDGPLETPTIEEGALSIILEAQNSANPDLKASNPELEPIDPDLEPIDPDLEPIDPDLEPSSPEDHFLPELLSSKDKIERARTIQAKLKLPRRQRMLIKAWAALDGDTEEEKVQKLCEMGISIFIRDKLIPPELLEKYNSGKKF